MFGKTWKLAALPLAMLLGAGATSAQEANPTQVGPGARRAEVITEGPNGMYIYHVKVVQRELDAVNYFNRSGSTHVDFQGTDLMPTASGEAKVDSQTGKTHIQVKLAGLSPANGFGPEYLTYVLWAISADGRPQNLGELELDGHKASLDVTSSFQSFGLIVTAEPYFAVSSPSDVVVLRNVFSGRTTGVLDHVNVHYSLLPRGLYANTEGRRSNPDPVTDREHYPLALYEAHNAARIAEASGAAKYASDIWQEVRDDLRTADDLQAADHRDVKKIFTFARNATQRAEDARIVALRKQEAEREAQTVADKERAQQQAVSAQQQAASAQQQAADAQQMAAAARAQAEQAAREKAEADEARRRAEEAEARARAAEAAANANAQKSQEDAAAVREKLRSQLNSVLQTSESARGLIVNLSDVLFDTAKYTLKPDTKISLAKVATILQLYPGLKVQVEGYTDSVGGDDYNQKLSENRAASVRDFLVQNGVPDGNVTATGYGKTHPVADNGTAAGRAQNRRVELVVSGDAIGVQQSAPQ